MIVVADTSPVNYLVLFQEIDVLPKIYGPVVIPQSVLVNSCQFNWVGEFWSVRLRPVLPDIDNPTATRTATKKF